MVSIRQEIDLKRLLAPPATPIQGAHIVQVEERNVVPGRLGEVRSHQRRSIGEADRRRVLPEDIHDRSLALPSSQPDQGDTSLSEGACSVSDVESELALGDIGPDTE